MNVRSKPDPIQKLLAIGDANTLEPAGDTPITERGLPVDARGLSGTGAAPRAEHAVLHWLDFQCKINVF